MAMLFCAMGDISLAWDYYDNRFETGVLLSLSVLVKTGITRPISLTATATKDRNHHALMDYGRRATHRLVCA
jgi:hypothetical protein